jgi:hypothetical protein
MNTKEFLLNYVKSKAKTRFNLMKYIELLKYYFTNLHRKLIYNLDYILNI